MIFFILSRVLFVVSMIFIICYVFGNFSRHRSLSRITKVATIVAIIYFIGTNIFFARLGWGHRVRHNADYGWQCDLRDSTVTFNSK